MSTHKLLALPQCAIWRGGATSAKLPVPETNNGVFAVFDENMENRSPNVGLRFSTSSKGGGDTVVQLDLRSGDWALLLPRLAQLFLSELTLVLAESTVIAVKNSREKPVAE